MKDEGRHSDGLHPTGTHNVTAGPAAAPLTVDELTEQAVASAGRGLTLVLVHGLRRHEDGRLVCRCAAGGACPDPGKHPILDNWQRQATRSPDAIRKQLALRPEPNLATLVGPWDEDWRLVALDVDDRHGGDASLEKLVGELGGLPETLTDIRGSRAHLFFYAPVAVELRGKLPGYPGIELKGGGRGTSAVTVPPTLHESGERRRWLDPDQAIAFLPGPLLELLAKPATVSGAVRIGEPCDTAYGRGALARACEAIRAAQEGERNEILNREAFGIGGLVAGGELLEDSALPALSEAVEEMVTATDGNRGKALRTLADSFSDGQRQPRGAPETNGRPQRSRRTLTVDSPSALRVELHQAFAAYLALEDTAHIDFSLAVALTDELEGDPVWGMLVAPSSSSKTEVVRSFADVADDHLDEISAAGLLSWRTSRKRWEPVGLLARHPGRAFATIGDFSTLLALSDKGARDVLYALLRRAYDGSVQRELGNAPGPLTWRGRLTLLAAVTPAIDNYATHADQLGSRWLYLRLPAGGLKTRKTSSATARQLSATIDEHRERVRELTARVVSAGATRLPDVSVGEELGDAIDQAAIVASYGRGAVERSGSGRREILGLPVVEEPPRLASALEKIARGALALGFADREAAALCRRVGLDSMPEIRRRCLEAFCGAVPVLSTSAVAREARAHYHVARRALEELEQVELLDSRGSGQDGNEQDESGPRDWMLAADKAELVRDVLSAPRWGCTKSV